LIDESILILGNHNWSRQALTVNKEVSVMIEAFPPDPEYISHFCVIELAKPEETEKGRLAMIKELQNNLLERTKLMK
jgi:phosphatidylserine/phosphatidylglycerophosphate/cardiolipin synthase-like enzyme